MRGAKPEPMDPFGLVNRPLSREKESKSATRRSGKGGYAGRDPATDPELAAYLRARHPDFDEYLDALRSADYKTLCGTDAQFANRYRIPPLVEPVRVFQGH